jgi:hypothetical protein
VTTPAGGAYSTVVAMLAGVEIDDPVLADFMEIREHAEDGTIIARTYAGSIVDDNEQDFSHLTETDQDEYNDPENADSLKLSWDLYGPDYKPVTALAGLLEALGLVADRKGWETIANMTALPVWDVAPASLKKEVEIWLGSAGLTKA